MPKTDLTPEAYDSLVDSISKIVFKKGFKATTMDSVAAALGMSKRTLYEIFDNKSEMLREVMTHIHRQCETVYDEIYRTSDNVMHALARILLMQQHDMQQMSVDFFRDMDSYYSELREFYEENQRRRLLELMKMFRTGIHQGVFRSDVNYSIAYKLLKVQMESLKRMEELFPKELTMQEVYGSISIGFLRSISTIKGMKILDEICAQAENGIYKSSATTK